MDDVPDLPLGWSVELPLLLDLLPDTHHRLLTYSQGP